MSWSLINSCVTTVTDCGTSRNGVGVFVALLMTGAPGPAGALTVTASRTPAICRTNSRESVPRSDAVTAYNASRNPSATALMV